MEVYDVACQQLQVNKKASEVINMMKALIKTQEDYDELVGKVANDRNGSVMFALRKMRVDRIGRLSIKQFLDMFAENKKHALEMLLQEHIKDRDVKYVIKQKVTPEQIFEAHKENPMISLKQILYRELNK